MNVILVCENPSWGIEDGTTVKAKLLEGNKGFKLLSVEKGSIDNDLFYSLKQRSSVPMNGRVWKWKVVSRSI